jgi:chromosome segregation ATPase
MESQQTRQAALNDVTREQSQLESDERKLNESMIKDKAKSDGYAHSMGLMQDLIEQRVKSIKALSEMLGLNLNVNLESQSLSIQDLGSSMHRIQRAIDDKEDEMRDQKTKDEKKEVEIQQEIDKVRDEKTKAETNIATQRQRVKTLGDSQDKTKREISAIERSMPNFNQLIAKIESAERELEKVRSENNADDLEEERMVIEAEKNELEGKAEALESDVDKLDSISKVTNELDQKERELEKDQSEFVRIKNKQSTTLKQLFPGKLIERSFKTTVQTFSEGLESEVKAMKTELQTAKMDGSRLHTEREHLRNQHKRKEAELREVKEKVEKVSDGEDFMDLMASQKEKVDKLNMELAFHKSSESTFR